MAKNTTRDQIWAYSLNQALKRGEYVSAENLVEELEVSEKTARDTLLSMSQGGWLERKVSVSGKVRYVCPQRLHVEVLSISEPSGPE